MNDLVEREPRKRRVLELPGAWEGPAYLGRLFLEAGFDVERLENDPVERRQGERFERYASAGKRAVRNTELASRSAFDIVVSDEPLPHPLRDIAPVQGAISCVVAAGTSEHPVRSNLTLHARSGLMFSNGYPDMAPRSVNGTAWAYLSALMCFGPALRALQLPPSERPAEVSVSGYELAVTLDYSGIAMWEYLGLERQRPGRNIGQNHPVSLYRCRDGAVFLNVVTEEQWQRLCVLVGNPALADDPRFRTSRLRRIYADDLNAELDAWLLTQSAADVVRACQELRVPCEVVQPLSMGVRDAQLLDRDFWANDERGMPYPRSFAGLSPGWAGGSDG